MNRMKLSIAMAAACMALAGCASKMEQGYGVSAQAERQAALAQAGEKDAAPDTPGMYLAHIDAFEKQYGPTPDTILLRADALRQTGQLEPGWQAYSQLLKTPLASRGYRGLGLLAGQAGDFATAASQFDMASKLDPTDALTLSDLGYARLRLGDVTGARVPLMKAAELAENNPKVLSNVVLYLLADGQSARAQSVVAQQHLAPDVVQAIGADAKRVAMAARRVQADVAHNRADLAAPGPQAADGQGPAQAPLTGALKTRVAGG
jgi:Flp pilus assembly protein TadD